MTRKWALDVHNFDWRVRLKKPTWAIAPAMLDHDSGHSVDLQKYVRTPVVQLGSNWSSCNQVPLLIFRHLPDTWADFRRNDCTVGRYFSQSLNFRSFPVYNLTRSIYFYLELAVKIDHLREIPDERPFFFGSSFLMAVYICSSCPHGICVSALQCKFCKCHVCMGDSRSSYHLAIWVLLSNF